MAISSQSQAYMLTILLELVRSQSRVLTPELLAQTAGIVTVRIVPGDEWYTRAWVIQESLSAGEKLYLAFRLAKGVDFPLPMSINEERSSNDSCVSAMAVIPVGDLKDLVHVVQGLCFLDSISTKAYEPG